jgi:peptidoglycan/xylan/chitin deacetylase (PgdA/CDA1 family)
MELVYHFSGKSMRKIIQLVVISILLAACQSITGNVPEIKLEKNEVILTFDDGPNAHGESTARLLDVLKKYNIRAVFTLLGVNIEQNPDLVRRIYDEGHIIVSHGYSGKWASKMKDEEFRENLLKWEVAITGVLGAVPQPKFYQPHGGFYYKRHEQIWREEGWKLLGTHVRAWDAAKNESKKQNVIKMVISKTEKNGGGLILLHDAKETYNRMEAELVKKPNGSYNRAWIPETVEEIIVALLEKGYRIEIPALASAEQEN